MPVACAAALGLAVAGGCGVVGGSGAPEPDATPTLPVHKAGTVEEFTLNSMESPPPPDGMTVNTFEEGGYLRGPHFSLKLSWSAVGPELESVNTLFDIADLTPRRAPEGHELILLGVDPQYRKGHYKPGKKKPRAELVVGERETLLESLPLPPSEVPVDADATVVVAAVPDGAPVKLKVTDEGRAQTLDARTGERGEDAIEGYYRPNYDELPMAEKHADAGVSVLGGADHVSTTLKVDFTNITTNLRQPHAFLAPYTPQQGWAPDGRAWLVVTPPRVFVEPDLEKPGLTLKGLDPQLFRIRLPSGELVHELDGERTLETHMGTAVEDYEDLIFNVSEDFTKGELQIDLASASVMAIYRDGELPGTWSPAPKPIRYSIRLE